MKIQCWKIRCNLWLYGWKNLKKKTRSKCLKVPQKVVPSKVACWRDSCFYFEGICSWDSFLKGLIFCRDTFGNFQTLWYKILKTMVESMHDDTIRKLKSRNEDYRTLKRILEECQSAELKTFKAFQAQKVTIEELREKCHDQQYPDQEEISKKISRRNGRYRCEDCGYQSPSVPAIKSHVESQHLDHTYRCKKCGIVTKTWKSYLRHMRLKHMIRKNWTNPFSSFVRKQWNLPHVQ